MGNKGGDPTSVPAAGTVGRKPKAKIPPPVALSPEAAKQFRPLKRGGNPTPSGGNPPPSTGSTPPSN